MNLKLFRSTLRRLDRLGLALVLTSTLAATDTPGGAPSAAAPAAQAAPAYDRQVNLVYTVNNLGYTDTCG